MLPILRAQVYNPYRSKKPRGFYHAIKGHTGVDLAYVFRELPSHITGKVVYLTKPGEMPQMGNVMFIEDALGSIHVLSHLKEYKKSLGDAIKRGELAAITGNSGTRTTAPHLHWEVICHKPMTWVDRIMTRKLLHFSGYNANPPVYLKNLYFKFNVDLDGNDIITI